MEHRPIRFVHGGQIVSVERCEPTRNVLDWLRNDARRTGTKEGCAEGDCGACTVIVAELADEVDATDAPAARATVVGGLSLRPVNACIRLLPTLDGRALLTVEDLAAIAGTRLHPVQQALVDHHGSQCGFCTPGFAMSMAASYERHAEAGTRPTRAQLADDLAGNLCRCTGYRPILDAGEAMFGLPAARLDTAPLVALLKTLRDDPPLVHVGPSGARHVAPRTLAGLADARLQMPQARLLAGGTDIGLWVNKQMRELGDVIAVGDVRELKRIAVDGDALHIGAGATLEDAWSALAAHWPEVGEMARRFAGPPVRHAGTLGGNVANGSPIGDGAPVLMALQARLLLRRGDALREIALDDFYVDYMKNRLEPGEFVQAIVVPLRRDGVRLRAYKVSKRFDCDISGLSAVLAVELDGGRVRAARFVYGGMAATVKHAAGAEAALLGRPWDEATLRAAMAAVDADFTPLTDLRADAAYRREVARNLLRRFWLETRDDAPLPAAQTRVWASA